jgi:hypothetical protein
MVAKTIAQGDVGRMTKAAARIPLLAGLLVAEGVGLSAVINVVGQSLGLARAPARSVTGRRDRAPESGCNPLFIAIGFRRGGDLRRDRPRRQRK